MRKLRETAPYLLAVYPFGIGFFAFWVAIITVHGSVTILAAIFGALCWVATFLIVNAKRSEKQVSRNSENINQDNSDLITRE